jgi:hypothetical protein
MSYALQKCIALCCMDALMGTHRLAAACRRIQLTREINSLEEFQDHNI